MNLFIRADTPQIEGMLNDDMVLNLFAVGESKGVSDERVRIKVENALFGIPESARAQSRPVYGYLHSATDGMAGSSPVLGGYGKHVIRLRRSVRERVTFTVGDSLDETDWGQTRVFHPAPIGKARWSSTPSYMGDILQYGDLAEFQDTVDRTAYYVEAQYHGPVRPSDFEEVILAETPSEDMIKKLRVRGVRWRVL